MEVKIIREAGYEESMLGMSLSWASNPERAKQIAPNLAHKQGGHNKFMEMIMIWMDVTFPRSVWAEADTYRISSKQSESTIHTITKNVLTQKNFENPIYQPTLEYLNGAILEYQKYKNKETFLEIKNNLPEGFLQRRIWCLSYKTLQNIYHQRKHHKLPQWKQFLEMVLSQIEHPEFIINQKEEQ